MAEQLQNEPQQTPQRPRTPRQMESFIEQRIREAVDRGDFDNLETKGQPLALDLKDAIDREAWFVNRTMKSLGAVPAWMELGKEIDAAEAKLLWMRLDFERWIAETREELLSTRDAATEATRAGVELRFDDRFARYAKQAEELRRLVDRFNLEVPVRALEKPGVWIAHELNRLSGPYSALCGELGWEPADPVAQTAQAPVATTTDAASTPGGAEESSRKRRLLELWRHAGKGQRTG